MTRWVVQLTCCGYDDGKYVAETWEKADQFRESYVSGAAVYAGAYQPGRWEHWRSAILRAGNGYSVKLDGDSE